MDVKHFITFDRGANAIKLFFFKKELECLSLSTIFILV